MTLTMQIEPAPLSYDAGGVIRVGGTRVTLDQLVFAFHEGATAEEIAARYSVLDLRDVYDSIAYYLRHRDAVDGYIAEQARARSDNREEAARRFDQSGLREQLLARLRS